MENGYTLDELMVVEGSRYISDGDTVLVGTGLPMVASLFAQKNHAPHMCYIVETGPVAPEVIPTPTSVSDARVMHRAVRHGSLVEALGGILQRGLADVAFLGGAQIDQFANVNSTVIGDYHQPKVRHKRNCVAMRNQILQIVSGAIQNCSIDIRQFFR